MTTTFAVRVDAKLKKDAEAVAKGLGMDLATCVRMLFTQMSQRGTLPLPRLTVNGFTEEQEEALLRSAEDAEGRTSMTVDEFNKSIDAYYS